MAKGKDSGKSKGMFVAPPRLFGNATTDEGPDPVDVDLHNWIEPIEVEPGVLAIPAPMGPPTAAQCASQEIDVMPPEILKTGINELDAALNGGVRFGHSYIAAGTGRGKTQFVLSIARHNVESGRPVLLFATELGRREVVARLAAPYIDMPYDTIIHSGAKIMRKAYQKLSGLPIYIITAPPFPHVLTAAVRYIANRHKMKPLIIFDYLQSGARHFTEDDMRTAVAQLSLYLTQFASLNMMHVLTVSSISRANYKSDGTKVGRDWEGAGKESGELEYDGSLVLFLDSEMNGKSRIHIAKHRYGPSGQVIGLQYSAATGKFKFDLASTMSEDYVKIFVMVATGKANSANTVAKSLGIRRERSLELVRAMKQVGFLKDTGSGWLTAVPFEGMPVAKEDFVGGVPVPAAGNSNNVVSIRPSDGTRSVDDLADGDDDYVEAVPEIDIIDPNTVAESTRVDFVDDGTSDDDGDGEA